MLGEQLEFDQSITNTNIFFMFYYLSISITNWKQRSKCWDTNWE